MKKQLDLEMIASFFIISMFKWYGLMKIQDQLEIQGQNILLLGMWGLQNF